MPIFRIFAVALAAAAALVAPGTAQAATPTAPREFVALSDVAPTILQDIRYFTRHNFVGERVDGYRQPLCILTRPAAEGLRNVQ
ncbi:MAG TPA: D-alanyl-D-alanine dipeptidase, partial [Amycolatopsis sp.]